MRSYLPAIAVSAFLVSHRVRMLIFFNDVPLGFNLAYLLVEKMRCKT
jgi:hypothetical protein